MGSICIWAVGYPRAKPNCSYIFDAITKIFWRNYSSQVDVQTVLVDFPYMLSFSNVEMWMTKFVNRPIMAVL